MAGTPVKAKIAVTDVVRTSSTLVTITLDAEASYIVTAFTGTETITVTVPSTAVAGAAQIVATPTFTVSPANVNWYVSTSGSDSNDGLSPDATTANTSKPYLTLGAGLRIPSPQAKVEYVSHNGAALWPGSIAW